ncbi:MAG: 3-isopropylmalate dehydratase large subunit [Alphaproteobacteria bacterium]
MGKTLYEKVFDMHVVRPLSEGQYQVLVGLHLIHEVTSPAAFADMRERNLKIRYPNRTFATQDHANPTTSIVRPYADAENEAQVAALEANVDEFGVRYFSPTRGEQGIVHVIGPEQGLTQPGMIIVCGDSHTSTHGAFGALAFGIGTSQVRDVMATQTLPMSKFKVRKIEVTGKLKPGVYAKDVALYIMQKMGVKAGIGYAHEYAGSVIENFSMEERLTLCNLAVEAGARCGYVNPDETTYEYLRGRPYAPKAEAWDKAVAFWNSIRSDADAQYDDHVIFAGEDIEPMVTWGVAPDQAMGIKGTVPQLADYEEHERASIEDALAYMDFKPGQKLEGTKIDVAFIGSCTNGRMSDFEAVAAFLKGRNLKVAPGVKALVVPGSQKVRAQLIEKGLDKVFTEAGFEFREAGCSMCLALNPDKLEGRQVCASSSNRNFKGRQGSPTGRTLLMSPVMVAASAIKGEVTDPRTMFEAPAAAAE